MSKYLRMALSAALLTLLAWRTDWVHVGASFAHARLEFWLAAVALYVVTQIVSAWRWQILARPLGFERGLWQYAGFYFVGSYFNLVLPTSVGGDVVRAWYLDGRSGQRARAFVSVVVDRLSGLVILLALAGLGTAFCPLALPLWVKVSTWTAVGGGVGGFLALPRLARSRLLPSRFAGLGQDVGQSLALVFHPGVLALSVFVQVANVALVWLVGAAIAAPVPGAYYWIVVPMVSLLTLAPVSINGLGLREAGMVLFLGPLGVPSGTAVSVAFLWFCVFSSGGLLGGLVYLLGRFPRPEVHTKHEPVRHHSDQGRARQSSAAA